MSLGLKALNSSFIILIIKLIQRTLGIVSMLILARLLAPEDFGIVAIASLVVFFCDVLTESGAQQYIIQKEAIDDDDINSSWTLNIIFKCVVAVGILLLAPIIANYFEKNELVNVLYVISLILPLGALTSPSLILLKREFNYKPIMKLLVTEKVLSFIFTVSLAFYFKSYWAMIFGVTFSYAVKAIGSFLIYDYRPKFTLIKAKEQWAFSQWMLLKGAVGYSKSEFDTFIISKLFTFDVVGGFNLMKNLSTMPAREIIKPLTEPLLASFSRVKSDTDKLNFQIITSMALLFIFTVPITTFLFTHHQPIIQLLFDSRWWSYSPVLGILSILILNFTIVSILHEALISTGKIKFLFYYDLVSFVLIVAVLLSLDFQNIEDFSWARTGVAVVTVLFFTAIVFFVLKVKVLHLLLLVVPIFLAGVAAISFVGFTESLVEWGNTIELILSGIAFVITYFSCLILFYSFLYFRAEIKEFLGFILHMYKQVRNK